MTTKWGRSWTGGSLQTQTVDHTYSETTGRHSGWYYDNDGRMTSDDMNAYTFDEAGGLRELASPSTGTFFTQDGDGQKAKQQEGSYITYYLRSSVLGQVIAEIEPYDNSRRIGFVHANGQLIAIQSVGSVFWLHMDASQRSRRTTLAGGYGQGKDEVDPMGVKLDRPGFPNHNGGSGGGGKGAGGVEARVASLMELRMCDFVGMLVPCGIEESLQDHLGQSPGELRMFWEYGLWFGEGYQPSRGTVFLAAREIDSDLLNEFTNGEIDAATFATALIEALRQGGFMPIDDTEDDDWASNVELPDKTRLRSKFQQDPIPVPGPDPTLKPNGGMDRDQYWWFDNVFNYAMQRLKLESCARAIASLAGAIDSSGNLTRKPRETLAGLRATNGYTPGGHNPKGKIATTTGRGAGTHSRVILWDGFFLGLAGMHTRDYSSIGVREFSAMTLLHELAHSLGGGHPEGESSYWNDTIYDGCFGPNAK